MADFDKRNEGPQCSIARYESGTLTFPPTVATAQTVTKHNVTGTIKAIEIITTDTQDGITYTVAITNARSTSLFSEASLADNSKHWRDAISNKATQDADFNPIPCAHSDLTLTITPSNKPDAGNVGEKTAQVSVYLYVE